MMTVSQLLYERLPDVFPALGPSGRISRLRQRIQVSISAARADDALIRSRIRRGAAQALVRAANQNTVGAQRQLRLAPPAFASAWRKRLDDMLRQSTVDLPGWKNLDVAREVDVEFVWMLFDLASRARQHTIDHAILTPDIRVPGLERNLQVSTVFEFTIASNEPKLGFVRYGVCESCQVGMLYKISIHSEWQFCGFGSRALHTMETRHPGMTWHTSGQDGWAQGFYAHYRQTSSSPWTPHSRSCPHLALSRSTHV